MIFRDESRGYDSALSRVAVSDLGGWRWTWDG
jgi:hypothetical protein